jgi:hypothetical protein
VKAFLKETEPEIKKPSSINLLRIMGGALAGVFFLWLAILLAHARGQDIFQSILLWPGLWVVLFIKIYYSNVIALSPFAEQAIALIIGAMPAMIIGSMAFSENKKIRWYSGGMIVLYLLLSFTIGLFGTSQLISYYLIKSNSTIWP